jgi:membrane-associated phospholipid phosphatase
VRSSFNTIVLLALAVAAEAQAQAQVMTRDQARVELAKLFRAKPEERRVLLEAQESRRALAAGLDQRLRKFLEESWSFEARAARKTPVLGMLLIWNEVAMQATALDHTNPSPPGSTQLPPYFAEQFGPPRTARVMAIVHIAMDEAVNSISPVNGSYQDLRTTILNGLSAAQKQQLEALQKSGSPALVGVMSRAIIESAFGSLAGVYPNKVPFFEFARELSLREFANPNSPDQLLGAKIGELSAKAILDLRKGDRPPDSDLSTAGFPPGNPLRWHIDPISLNAVALGGNYTKVVAPFLIKSADAFRNQCLPGPPAPGTPKFIAAYKQVKYLGGDPNAKASDGDRRPTHTNRTGAADPTMPIPPPPADPNADETFVGIFWAYDASAYLCAPPRLYNMIATSVALRELPIERVEDFAHYLAFINTTMADAALAAWDGKFFFVYPRPVTYLREADADGTPEGKADPLWTPLGAQNSNAAETKLGNFSPPFPAYPSGHATFGGSLFRAMGLYFNSVVAKGIVVPSKTLPAAVSVAGVPFTFVSDEYNGHNFGPGMKTPRARVEAAFPSFKQPERLNADSRIYLGVHWIYDANDGIALGNAVADDAFAKFIKP